MTTTNVTPLDTQIEADYNEAVAAIRHGFKKLESIGFDAYAIQGEIEHQFEQFTGLNSYGGLIEDTPVS